MAEAPAGRWRAGAGAVAAGVAVLAVAVAADAVPKGGTASRHLTSVSAGGDVLGVVLVVLGVLSGAAIVAACWPDRHRQARVGGGLGRPRIAWWRRVLNAVAVLAPAALFAYLLRYLGQHRSRSAARASLGAIRPPKATAGHGAHAHVALGSGAVIGLAIAAVALVALLVALAFLARRRRARRALLPATADAPADEGLGRAATSALEALDAERDPRQAILRAYRALEAGMVRADARRAPSEAPLEFLDRLVAAGAPPPPASRLTELFELARFSEHAVSTSQRDEAISALDALRSGEEGAP